MNMTKFSEKLLFPNASYTRSQIERAHEALAAGTDPVQLDPWYMDQPVAQLGLPLPKLVLVA